MASRISPWFLGLVAVTVIGGVLAVIATTATAGGSMVLLTTGVALLVLGGWAVSLCLHEFGHVGRGAFTDRARVYRPGS
ncbi:MAG: hypothetical protein ACRDRK_26605 [Pseudonocardia sp.]